MSTRKLRVLVVDDTSDTVRSMEAYLKLAGVQTATASRGDQALQLARQFRPQVILLDILMPGMNGLEVLKRLRADAATKSIAVVMLAAEAGPGLLDEILRAGAQDYWIKSRIKYHDIAELVENVCRRHSCWEPGE
jgi:CheY-like chemotaxis protein